MTLNGATVLITGGTGSFGSKFVETILKEHDPKSVRVYSRDELKQLEMRTRFKRDPRLRFFIGDVRDGQRLARACEHVDLVVHAAALKQVDACEYNPMEAIKTNILGAENVINAALECDVEKVMALSTDKAVNPVNLYGATKLAAEKLFVRANAYSGPRKTRFACVRYGNVVGSRGSVVPVFREQVRSGEITITDERMTRFWITQEQAVRFILRSIERMRGGEVFIPKLPSTRIGDLADVLAPAAKRRIVGIRPGEKIHELLLMADEARHAVEFEESFVIEPEAPSWPYAPHTEGKPLPSGFLYESGTNPWRLAPKDLEQMLQSVP